MGPLGRYSVGPGIAAAGVVTEIVDKVNRSNSQNRRCALLAAAEVCGNLKLQPVNTGDVLDVAEVFLEWLAE